MKSSDFQRVYEIVVAECHNGCTDVRSTLGYMAKFHHEFFDQTHVVPGYRLARFLETLNFHAIRENRESLVAMFQEG